MTEAKQTDVQLIIPGRLSYFYGFKPYQNTQNPDAKPSYCTHVIIGATDPILQKIRDAQRAVAKAAWGEKPVAFTDDAGNSTTIPEWESVMRQLGAQDRLCLHKGDVSRAGVPDYAGKFYVSANSQNQPTILATRNGINVGVREGDPDAPYSGCFANVMVSIYAQGPNGKPSKFGKRVNAQLMGVQFVKHGQAFGGGKVAKVDEFGLVATDADAPAPMASGGDLY